MMPDFETRNPRWVTSDQQPNTRRGLKEQISSERKINKIGKVSTARQWGALA